MSLRITTCVINGVLNWVFSVMSVWICMYFLGCLICLVVGWISYLRINVIRLVSGFSRFTHVEVSHFKCLDLVTYRK